MHRMQQRSSCGSQSKPSAKIGRSGQQEKRRRWPMNTMGKRFSEPTWFERLVEGMPDTWESPQVQRLKCHKEAGRRSCRARDSANFPIQARSRNLITQGGHPSRSSGHPHLR